MRNLQGEKFPHRCTDAECREIASRILACHHPRSSGEWFRGIGPRDRDDWVAKSLISHGFEYQKIGRAVWVDAQKRVSAMVNEEDHLRVQALEPGWSVDSARLAAFDSIAEFEEARFAWSPRFGFLAASPHNCGDGMRLSAMFHLMALATSKRLVRVIKALDTLDVATRGLFGESSKAVGAFVQVSVARDDIATLVAAGEVLIDEERKERVEFDPALIAQKTHAAIQTAVASRSIGLADAVRVLGWVRWAAATSLPGYPSSPKTVDAWRVSLDFRTGQDKRKADVDRAVALRKIVEPLL